MVKWELRLDCLTKTFASNVIETSFLASLWSSEQSDAHALMRRAGLVASGTEIFSRANSY